MTKKQFKEMLAEVLRESATECQESSRKNPTPYAESFWVLGITFTDLANKLETKWNDAERLG